MTATLTEAFPSVKAQVSAFCMGIERDTSSKTTGAYRCDLQKLASELRVKSSPSRIRRHYLADPAEQSAKLIEETGFDSLGRIVEPPREQWARPQAMGLYQRLMMRAPGLPSVMDYEGDDLRHLAWMLSVELLDIDDDGRIHLLSDSGLPDQRRYTGAPVEDKRAAIGRTHAAEDVQAFVLEVWRLIADGRPPMDIDGDHRAEMTTKNGLRMSGRMMTYQANKLLAARIDANCNCLGRDLVRHAWDLADHGEGCAGRERWLSVDVVRRAIRDLMASGDLVRSDPAYLTRRGHTECRIPAAYEIPADAGWHAYVKHRRTRRPKPRSPLAKRLLGDTPMSPPPLDTSWLETA
jgi:hypothetical protein